MHIGEESSTHEQDLNDQQNFLNSVTKKLGKECFVSSLALTVVDAMKNAHSDTKIESNSL